MPPRPASHEGPQPQKAEAQLPLKRQASGQTTAQAQMQPARPSPSPTGRLAWRHLPMKQRRPAGKGAADLHQTPLVFAKQNAGVPRSELRCTPRPRPVTVPLCFFVRSERSA